MTKEEIIKSCTQGIAEDVNGKIYQLYDANKLYEFTRKNMIDKACEWLIDNRIMATNKPPYGFYIEDFKKAMEE